MTMIPSYKKWNLSLIQAHSKIRITPAYIL